MDTFKDLNSHNKKVTLIEDRKSWNENILITWLSHWKSKRRQNGGAACVATIEWMKNSLRTCTRTCNFSELSLSCFLSLLSPWNGSNGTRKMSKGQSLVVGESLNSCGKLWCCKVAAQFAKPPYWALQSAFTQLLLMLNWKKSFCYLESSSVAMQKKKQTIKGYMDGLSSNPEKKITLKIFTSFLTGCWPSHIRSLFLGYKESLLSPYWCRDRKQWRMHLTVTFGLVSGF